MRAVPLKVLHKKHIEISFLNLYGCPREAEQFASFKMVVVILVGEFQPSSVGSDLNLK